MNPSSGQALVTGRAHWNGYILCLYALDVDSRVDFLQTDIRAAAGCATLKVRRQARFATWPLTRFGPYVRDVSRKDKL
jgi:hypothetical protein